MNMIHNSGAPVLLLGFNRPDFFSRLSEKVSSWSPPCIYVALDGPRPENESDLVAHGELLMQLEQLKKVFPVQALVQERNLGCRDGVVAGLRWFFENEESGIILEDDCDPDDSFYPYCVNLLRKHRDNPEVLSISGHRAKRKPDQLNRVTFSRYPQIWGWAGWKRSLASYDEHLRSWPFLRESGWLERDVGLSSPVAEFWTKRFDQVFSKEIDTWDYQLTFHSFKTGSVTAIPPVNLIRNIGFDYRSTHTGLRTRLEANSSRGSVRVPLDTTSAIRDASMDRWLEMWSYKVWRSVLATRFQSIVARVRNS